MTANADDSMSALDESLACPQDSNQAFADYIGQEILSLFEEANKTSLGENCFSTLPDEPDGLGQELSLPLTPHLSILPYSNGNFGIDEPLPCVEDGLGFFLTGLGDIVDVGSSISSKHPTGPEVARLDVLPHADFDFDFDFNSAHALSSAVINSTSMSTPSLAPPFRDDSQMGISPDLMTATGTHDTSVTINQASIPL